jgi:hypothetical protein
MRTLRVGFRDRLSKEMWIGLCQQQPSVVVVPDISEEVLSQAARDIQRQFKLATSWAFLCVMVARPTVAASRLQLWVGQSGRGLLIHGYSGSSRVGLVAGLVADALNAPSVYMRMSAVRSHGPHARLLRSALRLPVDPEYDLQRVLRSKNSRTSLCLYRT